MILNYPVEVHRTRVLWGATQLVYEGDATSVTVSQIIGRAGVSRQMFYRLFRNREDCLDAVLDEVIALILSRVGPAYRSRVKWVDGLRAALLALLELFDEQRELAMFCLASVTAVPGSTLARRKAILDGLVAVLGESRSEPRRVSTTSPLAGEVVISGALAVVHQRLLQADAAKLTELLNPLMSMIVLPFLGAAAAAKEIARPVPDAGPARIEGVAKGNPLEGLDIRLTYRTIRVMNVIAAEAGLSNIEVSRRAGIKDQGQVSKMLTRLTGLGLVENTGEGQPSGMSNAWRLTPRGAQVEWAIGREIRVTGGMVPPPSASDPAIVADPAARKRP